MLFCALVLQDMTVEPVQFLKIQTPTLTYANRNQTVVWLPTLATCLLGIYDAVHFVYHASLQKINMARYDTVS